MHPQASASHIADPWARLWRTGVLHSCANGMADNYDREFLAFWLAQFQPLGNGDLVVDVGTGNGAIPLLARAEAVRRGLALEIHGVDLADIAPGQDVPNGAQLFEGIRFHPGTSMTRLPFATGGVALLCSQYAFEYAPRAEAAHEMLRVIGATGRAALVVHSADSLIAQVSEAQRSACGWLLRESAVLPALQGLLTAMAGANTPQQRAALAANPAAEAARHAFNRAATELMDRIEAQPAAQLLQQAAQRIARLVAQPAATADEAAVATAALRTWLEDEKQRLDLMQAAALDEPALAQVVQMLGASGLPVRTDRLLYGGATCMGWTIVVGHG